MSRGARSAAGGAFVSGALDRRERPAPELWAQVVTPSQKVIRLPAYYAGDCCFAMRALAEEIGAYGLGRVTERTGAQEVAVMVKKIKPVEARVGA